MDRWGQTIEENRRLNDITRNWSMLWQRTLLVVFVCITGIVALSMYSYFRVFKQMSGFYSLFMIGLSMSVLLLVAIIVGRVTAAFSEVQHTVNHAPFVPPAPLRGLEAWWPRGEREPCAGDGLGQEAWGAWAAGR